jgi:hypothetical protein
MQQPWSTRCQSHHLLSISFLFLAFFCYFVPLLHNCRVLSQTAIELLDNCTQLVFIIQMRSAPKVGIPVVLAMP